MTMVEVSAATIMAPASQDPQATLDQTKTVGAGSIESKSRDAQDEASWNALW